MSAKPHIPITFLNIVYLNYILKGKQEKEENTDCIFFSHLPDFLSQKEQMVEWIHIFEFLW